LPFNAGVISRNADTGHAGKRGDNQSGPQRCPDGLADHQPAKGADNHRDMRPALPDAQAARRHAADMLEQQSATKKRCRN
jgi:hypothetical protein